jgi:hypothetical protein
MIRILLSILSLFLLLVSCKKDNSKDDPLSDDFHDVRFNIMLSDRNILEPPVSGVVPSSESRPGHKLSDYFEKLEYYLYNSSGIKVASLNMDADDSAMAFKIPVVSLPSGIYTVVFLGRREKSTGNSSPIYFGDDQGSPYLAHSIQREVTDLFYASQDFEVKDQDADIDIPLRRPGGKFKIVIEDDRIANVERIGMLINGYTLFYPRSDNLAQRKDISLPILKNYITSFEIVNGISVPKQVYVDWSYENFVFTKSSNNTLVNATVNAYDRSNNVLSQKSLNNIIVERNKTTTVRLKLFD